MATHQQLKIEWAKKVPLDLKFETEFFWTSFVEVHCQKCHIFENVQITVLWIIFKGRIYSNTGKFHIFPLSLHFWNFS